MLSSRVQDTLIPSPLSDAFSRALNDVYHPTTNPNGIISLGIAENTLMYDDLSQFLTENLTTPSNLFGYGANFGGFPALRNALLRLYNSPPFNPVIPVESEDMEFTGGCSPLLDNLFWGLCDEGEGALIGMPLYGGFVNDLQTRSKVKLVKVSLKDYDPFSTEAVERYEEEFLKARKEGINVKVLVLCTPHNPLGQYPPLPHLS